jgi:hypothetical protein
MKHRIALIATLLAAVAAAFGVPATAAQAATVQPQSATTRYIIHNVRLGCIEDPGHGNVVYVRFTCSTYFNFIDPVTEYGNTWYLLAINGGPDCLNWDPRNGYVYADGCKYKDPYEMWEHHDKFPNGSSPLRSFTYMRIALSTCNDTGNSALIVAPIPARCHIPSMDQFSWLFETS